MFVSLLLSSWVLVLPTNTTVQPLPPDCEDISSSIELLAEPTGPMHAVCISLEQATTFHFDSPLGPGRVELQDSERFVDVLTGTSGITLLPPKDMRPGERFELVVHFPDGAAPASATLTLVGHPAMGTRQVEVFRRKRTVEDYQREYQEARAKLQRCDQDLERMRVESGPGGLVGLLASGGMGPGGVASQPLTNDVSTLASNALGVQEVTSYRSTKPHKEGEQAWARVAVAVKLTNPGAQPWTAKNAALVSRGREASPVGVVWQGAPILSGENPGLVVVELELPEQEARGTFSLKIWDETGMRLVTLGHVTFP